MLSQSIFSEMWKNKSMKTTPLHISVAIDIVTGRWCPHSGVGGRLFGTSAVFFYENGCNSETKRRKIDPKMLNRPCCRGLQTGPWIPGSCSKNRFSGRKPNFVPKKNAHFSMGTKSKTFLVAKTGNYGIFVAKFMITCSSIAFEDLLASSIARAALKNRDHQNSSNLVDLTLVWHMHHFETIYTTLHFLRQAIIFFRKSCFSLLLQSEEN